MIIQIIGWVALVGSIGTFVTAVRKAGNDEDTSEDLFVVGLFLITAAICFK